MGKGGKSHIVTGVCTGIGKMHWWPCGSGHATTNTHIMPHMHHRFPLVHTVYILYVPIQHYGKILL